MNARGPDSRIAFVELEALSSVLLKERPRYIAFSPVEADECRLLNEWLAVAPQSVPLCGAIAGMVSIADLAARLHVPCGCEKRHAREAGNEQSAPHEA